MKILKYVIKIYKINIAVATHTEKKSFDVFKNLLINSEIKNNIIKTILEF